MTDISTPKAPKEVTYEITDELVATIRTAFDRIIEYAIRNKARGNNAWAILPAGPSAVPSADALADYWTRKHPSEETPRVFRLGTIDDEVERAQLALLSKASREECTASREKLFEKVRRTPGLKLALQGNVLLYDEAHLTGWRAGLLKRFLEENFGTQVTHAAFVGDERDGVEKPNIIGLEQNIRTVDPTLHELVYAKRGLLAAPNTEAIRTAHRNLLKNRAAWREVARRL